MNIKDMIINFMQEDGFKGMNAAQISKAIHMEDSLSFTNVMKALNALEDEHLIARDDHELYFLSERLGYVIGTLRINPKGFGFVETKDASFYVGRDHLQQGMDQDEVYARTWTNQDGSVESEVIDIIEHRTRNIVGVVKIRDNKKYFLPDTWLGDRKIDIHNYQDYKLVNDAKVLITIDHYGKTLKCHIEKEIGYKYDPGVDILSVLLENDIIPEFPDDVMKEVKRVSEQIKPEEKKKREDLTKLLTITIDGEDAKDLDDAISVEKIEQGYRLGVHIADVSHYVREGSALDREAYHRGTSVYVVDRVVPMLPHLLCNGICSLNPRVERLTLTCMMDIDRKGNMINYRIFPSVIKTTERMTYHKVNQILSGDKKALKEYPHLLKMCMYMDLLSSIIRKRREGLGAIDFDAKEAKILVNDKGKPTDIVLRERGKAERMIEDFMVAANECVAAHMKWLEIPSMYRVHEAPEPKKMREFARIAKTLGYTLLGGIQNVYPLQLQQMLDAAKEQENYSVLSSFMLRSMQKAKYDNHCLGHFGLALQEYLHFTSPIRRYPDLVVHRMLHKYVFQEYQNAEMMEQDEVWCEEAAIQASKRERNAVEAEREVDDMKKAEYMEKYIGCVYEGIISGITKFGIFVELDNTIEGLIHISSIKDDYYHYDDSMKALIGEHSANVFKMGQKLKIKCVGANRFKREIDFELLVKKKIKHKRVREK